MLLIGIAGGSGAGKTTVARTIKEKLGEEDVALISQDWYYFDHSHLNADQMADMNFDHPDAFDNQLLTEHLTQLKQGKDIEVATYDYKTHSRSRGKMPLPAKPIVIIEGILILAVPEVRSLLDIKVFVDTDPDLRLIRRIERDIQERGSTIETVLQQYMATVKPMHDAFIEPSKRYADIIFPRGGENAIGISLIASLIEHYIAHHFSM